MLRHVSIVLLTAFALTAAGCAARHKQTAYDKGDARGQGAAAVDSGDMGTPLPCPVDPAEFMFGSIPWATEDADQRWGWGETEAAKVRSSMARPIEVCGVRGQLAWLLALTCGDGSHPFASGDAAHGARVGSMGAGGRCGTIIDAYSVPCPEGAYEIYVDLYHCAEGEELL
jgi:hypothetical protein